MKVERMFTVAEVGELIRAKPTKIYDLAKRGELRMLKSGRQTLVPESEIVRFQQSLKPARLGKSAA